MARITQVSLLSRITALWILLMLAILLDAFEKDNSRWDTNTINNKKYMDT